MTEYNKKEYYESVIAPMVEELKKECIVNNIPMFFTACVANSEEESEYVKEIVSPFTHNIELTEDNFPQHLMVCLGFKTESPVEIPDIDFSEDAGDDAKD